MSRDKSPFGGGITCLEQMIAVVQFMKHCAHRRWIVCRVLATRQASQGSPRGLRHMAGTRPAAPSAGQFDDQSSDILLEFMALLKESSGNLQYI
jgi:hypothetical protein